MQSEKFVEEHGGRLGDIAVYGQESNPTTRRLALMNLVLCHSLILGCLGSNEVSPQIAIFRGLTSFDPGHPTLNFSCDKALAIRGIEGDLGLEHADTFRAAYGTSPRDGSGTSPRPRN